MQPNHISYMYDVVTKDNENNIYDNIGVIGNLFVMYNGRSGNFWWYKFHGLIFTAKILSLTIIATSYMVALH